jgi:hypothetical protein
MPDFDVTVAGLRRWTATHDLHVIAAVELLIWHKHWIRRADFQRACVHDDTAVDGSMWIHWRQAREFFDSEPRGSTSELAILDLVVALGENRYRLSIMGHGHSQAIVKAVVAALGADRP